MTHLDSLEQLRQEACTATITVCSRVPWVNCAVKRPQDRILLQHHRTAKANKIGLLMSRLVQYWLTYLKLEYQLGNPQKQV
jgi:hypothetical protein